MMRNARGNAAITGLLVVTLISAVAYGVAALAVYQATQVYSPAVSVWYAFSHSTVLAVFLGLIITGFFALSVRGKMAVLSVLAIDFGLFLGSAIILTGVVH